MTKVFPIPQAVRQIKKVSKETDTKPIIKIDKKTNVNKENFCLVLFFKKADRIAIIKSSLLEAIFFNTQSA